MPTQAEAVEMFWAAVRDWDPSSTEIAQDICIQYELKLHELGVEALLAKNETLRAPLLYGGLFELDEDHSAAWTTRKYSDGYGVEVFFQYGDGHDGHDFWSMNPDVGYDDTSEERSNQAGAALAWLGLDAMKRVRASTVPLELHVGRIQNEIRHRKVDQPPPEINPPLVSNPTQVEAVVMQWWLWRVNKVGPKVTKTFDLSWPYVRDINRRTMERAELEHEMRDEVLPAVHRQGKSEEWNRENVGYMTAVKVKQRGPGGLTFWLTPPLTKFADLTEFYPDSWRVKHGHPEFWIQPEVFQHTGEIYQGTIGNLIPIEFSELQKHAETEESGGFITAALDAFQEKGWLADPRFLKLHPPPEINPPLVSNPAWLTGVIAEHYEFLETKVPPEWLPLMTKPSARGGRFTAEMKEYGCGAYGCVIPTLSKDVVLKVTTDTTETEFAAKFAHELVMPIVVEYHMAVALSSTYKNRRVSLLWRESADHVGDLESELGKRGPRAVSLVRSQHEAAARILLAIKEGVDSLELLDVMFQRWTLSLDRMGLTPELTFVATGMKRVWLEQKIFIADVHEGNLGLCVRDGRDQWVITDPGNVIVMR